jgi:hypothetical protein
MQCIQTRDNSGRTVLYDTLFDAFNACLINNSIWKISFLINNKYFRYVINTVDSLRTNFREMNENFIRYKSNLFSLPGDTIIFTNETTLGDICELLTTDEFKIKYNLV